MGVLTNHIGSKIHFVFSSQKKRLSLVFMSTEEAGGLQGDKVSAIQKGTWLHE
jgi:hypothetical protein